MINLTLATIADIVGGTLADASGAEEVTGGVEFDSRAVNPGDLFLAIPGARVDGHDFAETAMINGAVGVLAARAVGVPAVIVPPAEKMASDTVSYATEHDADGSVAAVLAGLAKLARFVVDDLAKRQAGLKVIGVTGSAGKTSTKDIIATVLRSSGPTVAPPGSFNNEIGHPYTALRCTPETKFLVAEMSARGIGHVRQLAEIAPPVIGVVLNVGSAHLGEFGSRENIAYAKGELVEALPESGIAILNGDDALVAAMSSRTQADVWLYSTNYRSQDSEPVAAGGRYYGQQPPRVWAEDIEVDALTRPSFRLYIRDDEGNVSSEQIGLQLSGLHQVSNVLAAVAVGLAAGIDCADIVAAVKGHVPVSAHRMDVRQRGDGVVVIDDAYNANPESMRAGLAVLAKTKQHQGDGARAIAVLGPMAELGEEAIEEHRQLIDVVATSGIDQLVIVGNDGNSEAMVSAASHLGVKVTAAAHCDEATQIVLDEVQPSDVVLAKASNVYQLWKVAEAVLANNGKQEN
ncbi:UDP-N-acetylmuramoyl-tripeptide--D-alanyl-D-alanine ligase [Corynebacterium mustelae]|uniref:UDP-N-acetylmuramoyl-tripeptide--D-alanyl-D-alanine ligase n=1 Tax=Corynebacterium mustelae TaxID=571915 RepID=A0A0G3GZ78_9CORY|nr:UDP-N-acetylmuramoyl-tripeptide--D-alanyl-D-alanine ligase [Corynebacterium mustelae]AKK06484.1 UDP-N-acetylmuramoyl-tripeptide--D-alanyl-D-alanine ligase [Corynebacterium mustelae]